jgi:hypothetical protein
VAQEWTLCSSTTLLLSRGRPAAVSLLSPKHTQEQNPLIPCRAAPIDCQKREERDAIASLPSAPKTCETRNALLHPPIDGASCFGSLSGTAPRPWIDWTLEEWGRGPDSWDPRCHRPHCQRPASQHTQHARKRPFSTALWPLYLVDRPRTEIQLPQESCSSAGEGIFRAAHNALATHRSGWRAPGQGAETRSRRTSTFPREYNKRAHVPDLIRCVACMEIGPTDARTRLLRLKIVVRRRDCSSRSSGTPCAKRCFSDPSFDMPVQIRCQGMRAATSCQLEYRGDRCASSVGPSTVDRISPRRNLPACTRDGWS